MSPRPVIPRVLAIVGGVGLVATALFLAWSTALAVIVSGGGPPDPFAVTGDPCCGGPDSWGQVAVIVLFSLVGVALSWLVLAAAATLIVWAARGRWPRRRWLFGPPVAAAAIAATLWTVLLVPAVGETPARADCATFSLRAGDWRSVAPHERITLSDGIDTCSFLDQARAERVRTLLGAPDYVERYGPEAVWGYDNLGESDGELGYGLTVSFRRGRVVGASGPVSHFRDGR